MSVLSDELKNAILDEDFYLTNDILERLNILMLESHRSNASEPPGILNLESHANHNI